MPSEGELRASFSRAAAWTLRNREPLLAEDNPMLWLFVRDAAVLSDQKQLAALAREYQSTHTEGSLWQYIFPDYNHLFLYGATCNAALHDDPLVRSLLSPAACDPGLLWLRSPWCRTHQLMGLRFVQKNRCEPDAVTARTVASVQHLILRELQWDFRVEDAYIQKVLMLAESGRRADIRGVWVRRILDAQRSDGGWDGMDVIVRLPGGRVLCWVDGRLYPQLPHEAPSNFHATAQGLYLLALLLQK
jgi:hypothetical protein